AIVPWRRCFRRDPADQSPNSLSASLRAEHCDLVDLPSWSASRQAREPSASGGLSLPHSAQTQVDAYGPRPGWRVGEALRRGGLSPIQLRSVTSQVSGRVTE